MGYLLILKENRLPEFNITVLCTFGFLSHKRFYKYYAALPLCLISDILPGG
jgi:hypothetical protein